MAGNSMKLYEGFIYKKLGLVQINLVVEAEMMRQIMEGLKPH